MTTLLQRCKKVAEKSEQLALAQRNASQQRLVQERTREWQSRYDKLSSTRVRVACLSLDVDALNRVAANRAQLRHNSGQVLERLTANSDISQLTDDAMWTRLLASVDGLTVELEAAGKAAWRSVIDSLGALQEPAWLRNQAPSTPANDAAIASYKNPHGVYAGLVRLTLPRSADDLTQLSQTVAACRIEAAKIIFDVPPDVQSFFQAVQADTATLVSLTPTVLEWLRENGQLDRYRIRSASR